jgi:alpha-beta hydrolase superfamily lysophospholipase
MTVTPGVPFEATARVADGTILRTLRWPAVGDAWATALVVHGLGEHIGRYGNVATPLAADGVDVHGYDHRGFGGSAGPRAYVNRWSDFHDDLQERLVALRESDPDRPLILYGHSLGGLIAAGYVLSDRPRPQPDLLMLSSPALDSDIPGWKRSMAGGLTRVVPRMRLSNGPLGDGLSHDPAIADAYARDPLCLRSSTVRLGHEAFEEQVRVRAAIDAIDRMPMPTFVFHGSGDPIVPVRASEPIGTKGNVTRHVHDGLRHETHHEFGHEHVMAEVVAWLNQQRVALGQASAPATATAGGAVAAEV